MAIDNPRTQSASLISVKNAPSAGAPTQYAEDAHMQHEERNLPGPHVTAHGVRASINPCAPTPAASPRWPRLILFQQTVLCRAISQLPLCSRQTIRRGAFSCKLVASVYP